MYRGYERRRELVPISISFPSNLYKVESRIVDSIIRDYGEMKTIY
jgi:hypothetical protein